MDGGLCLEVCKLLLPFVVFILDDGGYVPRWGLGNDTWC